MKMIFLIITFLFFCFPVFAKWDGSNLISGSSGTGNVVSNTGFLRKDNYVCADSSWINSSQTCESILLFQLVGSDTDYAAGNAPPIGTLVVRTYTKSTNTMGSSPSTVWSDATYEADELYVRRNDGENIIRIYITKGLHSAGAGHATEVDLIKTDLTGTLISGPTLVINDYPPADPLPWVDTSNPSIKLMPLLSYTSVSGGPNLYSTSDNGDTFTQSSKIPGLDVNNEEGGCIADFNNKNRILCVFRDQTQGPLKYMTSSNGGSSWSSLQNVAMPTMGTGSGVKVKPKLIQASGNTSRIVVYFYDRNINRLIISAPTLFNDAFNNKWIQGFLLGTSSNGNGGIMTIDSSLHKYIISTASSATPNNAMNWWTGKDIYHLDRFANNSKLGSASSN